MIDSGINKVRLKTIILILLIFTAFAVSGRAADDKMLIERQRSYFDAIIRRDYKFVDNLLAKDYMGTYALGIIDKTREMTDLRAFPLAAYEITEPKVIFLNPKTAIISFKLSVKVIVDGKEFYEDDFLSCTWTKHKKEWLLSAQSAVKAMAKS